MIYKLVAEATDGVLLVDKSIGVIITPPPNPKLPDIIPTSIENIENLNIVFFVQFVSTG